MIKQLNSYNKGDIDALEFGFKNIKIKKACHLEKDFHKFLSQ